MDAKEGILTVLVLFVLLLLAIVSGEDSPSSSVSGEVQAPVGRQGYHLRFGVPAARKLEVHEKVNTRISQGSTSSPGAYPYMAGLIVLLNGGQQSVCGGSLLSSNRVLTAATCKNDGYSTAYGFIVVVGSITLFSGGTRSGVWANTVISHPGFNPYTSAHDIAMLIIPTVTMSQHISPIRLPFGQYLSHNFVDKRAQAIGYGAYYNGKNMQNEDQSLRDKTLTVINNLECQQYYGYLTVSKDVMCTKGTGGPCEGDMGGPLVLRNYSGNHDMLIGVVSFGSSEGCMSETHPTGYTRITAYNAWIRSLL